MSSRGAAAPRGGVCSSQQDGGGGCSGGGGGERSGGAPSGPAAAPGPAAPAAPRPRPHRLLRDRADHRQGQLRRRQAGHPPGDPGQGEGPAGPRAGLFPPSLSPSRPAAGAADLPGRAPGPAAWSGAAGTEESAARSAGAAEQPRKTALVASAPVWRAGAEPGQLSAGPSPRSPPAGP